MCDICMSIKVDEHFEYFEYFEKNHMKASGSIFYWTEGQYKNAYRMF